MFNLNIAQPGSPEPSEPRPGERLFGTILGFVAGLVLIAAIDALFWNHMLWRTLAQHVAPGDPSLLHAVSRIGTMLLRR